MPPKNMYIASKRGFAATRRLYFEKTIINKNWFCSIVLDDPFCPVKQKLCRNECKVSMVKIPQHKVTKSLLIDNGFFKIQTSSSDEATETMYRVFGGLSLVN